MTRQLDERFRQLRQHCMSVPDTKRHASAEVIFESYPEIGFNYRMTDLQAAVGCEQLRRLPEIVARRRELAERYKSLLSGIALLDLPCEPEWSRSNWQSYCVRLPEGVDQNRSCSTCWMLVSRHAGESCAHIWKLPTQRERGFAKAVPSRRMTLKPVGLLR